MEISDVEKNIQNLTSSLPTCLFSLLHLHFPKNIRLRNLLKLLVSYAVGTLFVNIIYVVEKVQNISNYFFYKIFFFKIYSKYFIDPYYLFRRSLDMKREPPNWKPWMRCHCIQQKKSFGMRTLYQQHIFQEKVV